MGNRALAHIEKIVKTYPIEGADKVEMAQVLDFHVMVKKGQFKVGELVTYIEVDSILPDGLSQNDLAEYTLTKLKISNSTEPDVIKELEKQLQEILSRTTLPQFEFLRNKNFTIKAMKMNKFKIISQGIIFPMGEIFKAINVLNHDSTLLVEEGKDITSMLHIKKVIEDEYEDTVKVSKNPLMKYKWFRKLKKFFSSDIKGNWQSTFPSPSDEVNIQNIHSKLYAKYGDEKLWYVSEKLEGQSISFTSFTTKKYGFFKKRHFGVCSRNNFYKKYDGSPFWKTALKLNIEKRMKEIGKNLFIRGEHCGPKIQENIYGLKETDVYLYEVYDMDSKRFYTLDEFKNFCAKYGFKHVPILDEEFALPSDVKVLLKYSDANSVLAKTMREGVVIRLKTDSTISFKVKSPEYLAK
jgi:hypothetical protein